MLNFASDYVEGCHEKVLEALINTNMEQLTGYGSDIYTNMAKEKIKKVIGKEEAEVYLLTGGTQTNQVVISTTLKNYEGVIAATTGHIAVHESGAIEFSGHKVLEIPSYEGKIKGSDLNNYLVAFYDDADHDHMVFPGMVYISHPTEFGTLYSKEELTDIKEVCKKYNLPLFIDGARLGYGLMSKSTNVTIKDIANLADIFYIGGTKVGAMCGEAVVFTHGNMPKHFETSVKQHGALLAKGRLNGIQFNTLFSDNLYFEISKNAIDRAEELKEVIKELGYKFFVNSPTNQQFIIYPTEKLQQLSKEVVFTKWQPYDDKNTVIRLCTSWATTKEQIEKLRKVL